MPGRWNSRLASLALIGCEGGHTLPTGSTQRADDGAGVTGSGGGLAACLPAALAVCLPARLAGADLAAAGPAAFFADLVAGGAFGAAAFGAAALVAGAAGAAGRGAGSAGGGGSASASAGGGGSAGGAG